MKTHLCPISLAILLSLASCQPGPQGQSSGRTSTTTPETLSIDNRAITKNSNVTTEPKADTNQSTKGTQTSAVTTPLPISNVNSTIYYNETNNTLQIHVKLPNNGTRVNLFIRNWEDRSNIKFLTVNGFAVDVTDYIKDDSSNGTGVADTSTMPSSPPASQTTGDQNFTVTRAAITVVVTFLVTAFLFSVTLFVLYRCKYCVCRRGRTNQPLTEKLPKKEDNFQITLYDVAENEKSSVKVGFENLAFSESTPSKLKHKSGQVYELGNNSPSRTPIGESNGDEETYFYAGYATTSRSKGDDSKNELYSYDGLCAATPIEKSDPSQGDYTLYDDTHRKGVNTGDSQKVENITDSDVYALYDDSHRTLNSEALPGGQSDDGVYALYDDSYRSETVVPGMYPVAENNADFAIYANTHQLSKQNENCSNDYALYDDSHRQGETCEISHRNSAAYEKSQSSCVADRESNIYGSHRDLVRSASNKTSQLENTQLEIEENVNVEDEGELYINLYSN